MAIIISHLSESKIISPTFAACNGKRNLISPRMNIRDIYKAPDTKVFIITESDYDNELNWVIEKTDHELIPEGENYYLVKAFEVTRAEIKDCYLGVSIPERFADIVVKQNARGEAIVEYISQQANSIIPAIAHDAVGYYELFYAKENPQVGIEVLRNALAIAKNKSAIAEDIGYLLIDEDRTEEAIEAFTISETHGPTTRFTFYELAKLYAKLGHPDKQAEYLEKYKSFPESNPGDASPNG